MAATSSSTAHELPSQPQVFVNFRRELRGGFVSHLAMALKYHKINVFIDATGERGQSIGSILEIISKSRIALCVLSSWYAESRSCLDELKKIMDCVEEGSMVAIPIFYRLEPSTVRHLTGEFGDAFMNLNGSDEMKKQWKQALTSLSCLMGIVVDERSDEAAIIEEIMLGIKEVLVRSNVLVQPLKTQVFINFRGDQLRKNFIGYLVDALQKSKVNVFADNYLHIGDDLDELFKRIEDSGIAVVVFSSRYCESKWCLEELVKIKELVSQDKLKVIPVFYKVTSTNVKRLKGEFGDNFRDREWEFENDEPKIKRWKEAIKYVSHKFALTFDDNRNSSRLFLNKFSNALEIDFIGNIVEEVLKMQQTITTMGSIQSSR